MSQATNDVERWDLAPDLSIARVLMGLWQIADMERDGCQLDLAATAGEMEPYVDAGLQQDRSGQREWPAPL